MLKLFQYLNHEISGELSFLDDIKPNLSYFSKKDQVILFDYYQNKKTIREIASSYSCTESQIKYRLLKIEYQLVSFLHNKKIFKIPFDSIDKIVSNEKFLYEGDKVQMKKVFDLYFGQSSFQTKTIEEIIKLLDLPFERVTLQKKLLDFLISICKYEYGIRKQNAITSEDIKSFFIKNKIQNPFDSLNYRILCDVLKSKHTGYIDFSSNSKDRILEILKGKKKNKIPQAIRLELCAHFQIRNYELMNAKDQKKIYKILESLQKNREMSLKMSK